LGISKHEEEGNGICFFREGIEERRNQKSVPNTFLCIRLIGVVALRLHLVLIISFFSVLLRTSLYLNVR
jgi:hypothetical protein